MAVLCLDPLQQFFDNDGNPLAGGKLYTKDAVTLEDRAVYTETGGTVEHANPIILESDGRPPSPIFYTQGAAYNLILTDADDVTLDTNVSFEVPDIEGAAAAASDYFDIVFFKGGTPTEGERVHAEAVGHAVAFSANWAGSYGVTAATPPAEDLVITIKLEGVTVGTATLSTLNVWSFATSGGAVVEAVAGDQFDFYAPATLSTVVDVGFTLVGTVA